MLNLNLGAQKIEPDGEQVLDGQLIIGDFSEGFHASTSYWDRKKYLSQWVKGLEVILKGGNKSAFITTMYDPTTANFIFWWVMYLVGNDVYIQNHVLFMDELGEPFNESDFVKFVPERETFTEYGEPISEWKVSIDDIRRALETIENI
ncbi:hypothetical protein [Vibrio cionasavignyae]|uniref:hypothetical protein n=1 Tax=Vibrio cionasavignyae TaxID=2910252 RepID=UPI003D0E09FC